MVTIYSRLINDFMFNDLERITKYMINIFKSVNNYLVQAYTLIEVDIWTRDIK